MFLSDQKDFTTTNVIYHFFNNPFKTTNIKPETVKLSND